ncbi:MAG: aminotransferase class I/II-fold pyridoxal phosphate-dependent enzyme [Clostridia bacterium]
MNYDKFLSRGVKTIQPSGIRRFFDVANIYKDVISLGVGEPDFDTPWSARESAVKSIRKGYTQYTSNSGMPSLRKNICRYLAERFDVKYNVDKEIFVTVGASEAIDLAIRAIVDVGDEIVIPQPSYVSYCPCVTLCGGVCVAAECKVENNFSLMPEDLERVISKKTKALILPYPNNPTGAIMTRTQLEKIAAIAIKHDILIISDEIYSELTYGEKHVSIASLDNMWERTILINGFSKAFAMTGWRVGYVCAPNALLSQMLKIHQYVIMCAPTASQYCADEALERGFVDNFTTIVEMREQYDMRRRFLVKELNDMGLATFEPKGAFYVFPCVASLGMDGETFATKLLEEERVAVVPGEAFSVIGKNFVRISYAYSIASLQAAMKKIRSFVERHNVKKIEAIND